MNDGGGGGGMGRGSRGARRAQTARQAANEAEGDIEESKDRDRGGPRARGGGQDRGNRGGGRQKNNNPEGGQDKNSWIYKYHNLERPHYEKIVFTAETEIPDLPPAKDRLKEPSKADFDREMTAEDALIAEKRAKKNELIRHRRQVREGGIAQSGDKTRKGELTERVNNAKGIRSNKRQSQDQMRDIVATIQSLENEKRGLLK